MGIITILNKSSEPKYRQIIASIEDAIASGKLKKGDKLPSLNSIKNQYSLSRDTALFAFKNLKIRGLVYSIAGKGYYVKTEVVAVYKKIFLLFDEFNSFKEDLYNSFLTGMGDKVQIDIFFHHFNYNVFSKLINDNAGDYSYYVIMPSNLLQTNQVIKNLPKDRVFILDQMQEELKAYSGIYQNFEKDIFNNLTEALPLIKNYEKLILLFSKNQPQAMFRGFYLFCKVNAIESHIIESLENRIPKKGEIYIIPDDKNLLRIIKKIKKEKLNLKSDIGIISYNDSLLKEILEGGITTISTNFNEMGKRLAQMILCDEQVQVENQNRLIIRQSL